MRNRARILVLAVLALIAASSCSRQRPLEPEVPFSLGLREPFENREAEELAISLSEELQAPEGLYLRVRDDLASIRTTWGDTLPVVKLTFFMPMIPGQIVIDAEPAAVQRMKEGTAADFDSLNKLFGVTSVGYNLFVDVRSQYLVNPCYMLNAYARLQGVRKVFGSGIARYGNWYMYATQKADSIFYIFQDGWGDCPAGCMVYRYRCFRTTPIARDHLGEWVNTQNDSLPNWHPLIRKAQSEHYNCQDHSYKFVDLTPPARVNDLTLIGEQAGDSAEIWFTAPGDDGEDGQARESVVLTAHEPITDSNWKSVIYKSMAVATAQPGRDTSYKISVDPHGTNYVAIRVHDGSGNWSKVSNNAVFRNVWLNGWTYFNTSNSPLHDDRINVMIRDSRGRLWMGSNTGLACKDGETWSVYQTFNSGIPYDLITSVAEGPDGVIWVGTPQGLGRFDGNVWQSFTTANSSIPKQEIRCVEVTNDGVVWLGYGQYGVVRYDHETWTVYDQSNSALNGSTVNAMFCDSRGVLWIGTNYGVTRFDGESWTAFDPTNSGLGAHYSVAFFEDADGQIWCGSSTDGVSWFDGSRWQSHEIGGWHVKSFAQFANGPIWIGATGGVWKHESDDWLGLSGATTGLPSNHCTGLVTEGLELLWIATADKGLCRWDLHAAKMDQPTSLSVRDE